MLKTILTSLNMHPTKGENTYNSPFTNDKTPSFHVKGNLWNDFSYGKGGNHIQFLIEYYQLKDESAIYKGQPYTRTATRQAFKLLEDIAGLKPLERVNNKPTATVDTNNKPSIELVRFEPIDKLYLYQYAQSRGLSRDIVNRLFNQVVIHHNKSNRDFYSLGWKNDSEGVGHRNAKAKGNVGKSDITTIRGTTGDEVLVFEGYMSFASYCQIERPNIDFMEDVIILNSANNWKKVNWDKYKKVYGWLDNDTAGDETTFLIMAECNSFIDERPRIRKHNDYNDFICNKLITDGKQKIRVIFKYGHYFLTYKGKFISSNGATKIFKSIDEVRSYLAKKKREKKKK